MRDEEPMNYGQCNHAGVRPLHQCPYQVNVHEDSEFECDCCQACTQECAWDI